MTVYEQHFDGPNGTAITAANSAAPGNTTLTAVNVSATTITYDTSVKMHGTGSMKLTTSGSGSQNGAVVLRGNMLGVRSFSWRAYINLTSLPAGVCNLVFMLAQGATQNISLLNVQSSGAIGYTFSSGTPSGGYLSAATFTPALNHWYRYEGTVVLDQTNGSLLLRVYDGDSTTPLATMNPTGIATADGSTNGFQQLQVGKGTSTPVISPFNVDDIAISDSTTPIGPYIPANPSVVAGGSIAGSVATLAAVANTYDNAAPTYAWTQTAGPVVTLNSATTASPTATLVQAGNYTFRVVITDDLNKTANDSITLTYAGATTAPAVTGTTLSSPRWVEVVTGTPVAGGTMSYVIAPSTGVTQLAPGVFSGATPNIATTYQVTATESSNANSTVFRFTIPGSPTATGGLRILVANDDSANGGTFS